MKTKTLLVATALMLSLGAGAANATEATPTPEPTVTVPAQEDDPTLVVVLTPPYLGADGQIVGPQPVNPILAEYFTWWSVTENNMVTVTAAVIPGGEASIDLTLTDRSGATDLIVFDPIALPAPVVSVPDAAESYPAPAPVATTPEEDEPGWDCETMGNLTCGVPVEAATPVYAPDAATSERVAAGEELAYTGANTGALALGVGLLGLGALAVRYSRRTA